MLAFGRAEPISPEPKTVSEPGENEEEMFPFENLVGFCGFFVCLFLSIVKSQPIVGFLSSMELF